MFGRQKTSQESVFEIEERLQHELQGAREQLAQTTAQIVAAETAYKQAASDAVTDGDDSRALALRRDIEKLQVRRDGLDAKIAAVEPRYQEANKVAQAERVAQAEQARRGRLAALVSDGQAAVKEIEELFEPMMRAIDRLDDVRQRLATTAEFGSLVVITGTTLSGGFHEGLSEANKLADAVTRRGPDGLRGRLVAAGWRERTVLRPTVIEIVGLAAPPK